MESTLGCGHFISILPLKLFLHCCLLLTFRQDPIVKVLENMECPRTNLRLTPGCSGWEGDLSCFERSQLNRPRHQVSEHYYFLNVIYLFGWNNMNKCILSLMFATKY